MPSHSQFEIEPVNDIDTNLDPRLQKAILQARAGVKVDPAVGKASHGRTMIDVLVELFDPSQSVPGLNIPRPTNGIMTGTVDVNNISTVRRHPNIKSLKAARRVKPALKFSVPEVQGTQAMLKAGLPPGAPDINGAGVVIGIVDYGADFVHPNFRKADGTTRLRFLWDQGTGLATQISPVGFPYGREFTEQAINEALDSVDPYQTLAYDPGSSAHGTHVMDIAAGNGGATGAPGVAPAADLIFVHLSSDDTPAEENFGNSSQLIDAVEYIFEKAHLLHKHAVVNLSLGTNGGPHDGTSLVERRIDELLEVPGRAVVIAASNNWEDRIHASGHIAAGEQHTLTWELPDEDQTDNEVEIWYGGNAKLEVSLVEPSGAQLGPFALASTTLLKMAGVQVGAVFHRHEDPNNHDNQIDILLDRTLSGQWSIVLQAIGSQPVNFHAWIERDDSGSSKFATADEVRSHTIGSIACGRRSIVVGSYDARVPGREISSFSAAGPTRDGRRKPEVSAPGHEVLAANSKTLGAFHDSGTSMAAPHVTGLIALLMQATPQPLTASQIRNAVLNFARRDPPLGSAWEPRYGAGRINAAASLRSVIGVSHANAAAPVEITPELIPANGNGNGNGHVQPYSFFEEAVAKLIETSAHSKLRLRLEIEVEPMSSSV